MSDIAGRPLSRREWVVLCLWVSGASRQQIADSLGIQFETAKSYVRTVADKTGARTAIEAAERGVEIDRPPVADTPDLARSG